MGGALCANADNKTKYRVHFDHTTPFAPDLDRNGDTFVDPADICVTTSDDTVHHRDTGPGVIAVNGSLLTYTVNMYAPWGCNGTSIPGAQGTAVGTGASNTAAIVDICKTPGIAASIADNYSLNGYNDWFLPSKDELHELYLQRGDVGGFASSNPAYSSTTKSTVWLWSPPSDMWGHNLDGPGNLFEGPKTSTYRVRAIRAF